MIAIATGSKGAFLYKFQKAHHFRLFTDDMKERLAESLRMEEVTLPPERLFTVRGFLHNSGIYSTISYEYNSEKGESERPLCFSVRKEAWYRCKGWQTGRKGGDRSIIEDKFQLLKVTMEFTCKRLKFCDENYRTVVCLLHFFSTQLLTRFILSVLKDAIYESNF